MHPPSENDLPAAALDRWQAICSVHRGDSTHMCVYRSKDENVFAVSVT